MSPRIVADLALHAPLRYKSDLGASRTPGNAALLTGGTGFLGRYLLNNLLRCGSLDEIICLVRASDNADARARVLHSLPATPDGINANAGKIIAVAADISKPDLGMPADLFEWVARRAGIIFHCAAQINLVHPYRSLRLPNVLGTYELLKLAAIAPAKSFHHISSIAVLGSAQITSANGVLEDFRLPYPAGPVPGYSQSKWVAEQLVNSAAENGLRACIFRPGVITGDSRTGMCNTGDALSLVLTACLQLRTAPDSGSRIYVLPVDYVSRVILELSQQPESPGNAFHIVNLRALPWLLVTTMLSQRGYIDRVAPYREWAGLVREHAERGSGDNLAQLACMLSDSPGAGNSPMYHVDDTNTQRGLARAADFQSPEDDLATLERYVRWLSDNLTSRRDEQSPHGLCGVARTGRCNSTSIPSSPDTGE